MGWPTTNQLSIVILIGILFHCIFMYSIFDIYFRSPIVHGMQPFSASQINSSIVAAADRLVFIVGDGMRADKFFEWSNSLRQYTTPFLRKQIQENGASWGVSHTRVPTESRPGHVAMFAGFYEDVSAVFTGWKENLVEFDSVFNQSQYVLAIGSPDVVNMFSLPQVDRYSYPAEFEDFGSTDPTALDNWVFEKLEHLLQQDASVQQKLQQPKTILFLHLLGCDSSGHTFRPPHDRYLETIQNVDRIVEKTVETVEKFFHNDKRTAYIVTADHGMTTRGSHGDGDPECTRTPLVAFGSGIRSGKKGKTSIVLDGSCTDVAQEERYVLEKWKLDPLYRKDVKQADLAPLISSLLSLPYPINNVGVLPIQYLNVNEKYRSTQLFANALQIHEQFLTKQMRKREQTRLFFRPFAKLYHSEVLIREIQSHLENEFYAKAQTKCFELIHLSLEGLNYYQTYDWTMLMTTVTVAYIGWMVYILVFSLKHFTLYGKKSTFDHQLNNISLIGYLLWCVILYVQHSPLVYYLYALFAFYFVGQILGEIQLIQLLFRSIDVLDYLNRSVGFLIACELLVVGFFRREIFSVCFIALGIVPSLLEVVPHFSPRILWIVTCIVMSFFTLFPLDYGSDLTLVCLGGILFATIAMWRFIRNGAFYQSYFQKSLFILQFSLVLFATYLVYDTETALQQRQGLSSLNAILNWSISGISLILPLFSSKFHKVRQQSISLGFVVPFILLSISYEVLFFCGLELILYMWCNREIKTRDHTDPSNASIADFPTALMLLFLFCVGFFGTGNLASIASFDLSSVFRFATVFSPFLMTALCLFKAIVPMLLAVVAFGIILQATHSVFATFLYTLALADVLTLNFFFLVSDYGSWMEIGNSISRFAICNCMIIILLVFFSISQIYVRGTTRKQKTV